MKPTIKMAQDFATKWHEGQERWDHIPYITHPISVSQLVTGKREKIVALLHDVLEDSECTVKDLIDAGFDEEVVNAVIAMTKIKDRQKRDCLEYLLKVKQNTIAKIVKIADIKHNMSCFEKKTNLYDKYQLALHILES